MALRTFGLALMTSCASIEYQPFCKLKIEPVSHATGVEGRAGGEQAIIERMSLPHVGERERFELYLHRYKLRFKNQPSLQPVLNCRRAQRVRPDPSHPILVGIKTLEAQLPIQAVMNDISATGVSILVPLDGEAKLFSAGAVEITFQLPGLEGLRVFAANVCYRRLAGDHVSYGIDFDPNTPEFEAKQSEINGFVNSGIARRMGPNES